MVKKIFLFFSLLVCFHAIAADKMSAELILERSDKSRGALSDGLVWQLEITNSSDQQKSNYSVKVKGINVLATCIAPARQKGETYLFNDRNLWIYKPGLRKPVSLSPRQRLTGQAAIGDIATTKYARDYEASIVSEEQVLGKNTYKLALKAKAKNVTYDKINYWVTKDDFLGIKAEFLTIDGNVFKTANFEYKNSVSSQGKKIAFISRMTIQDASVVTDKTVITYNQPDSEKFSDSIFNVNNLVK